MHRLSWRVGSIFHINPYIYISLFLPQLSSVAAKHTKMAAARALKTHEVELADQRIRATVCGQVCVVIDCCHEMTFFTPFIHPFSLTARSALSSLLFSSLHFPFEKCNNSIH